MKIPPGRIRGQAALFDGLTFLGLVMFSVTFIFLALSSYGNSQQRMVTAAHITNYLQDAFKSIYYIDASTLSGIKCDGDPNYCKVLPATPTGTMGCEDLAEWKGVTVAELIKRDLRDFEGSTGGLNDMYGPAPAPGKLAARCAFKEIFKPFSEAGYSYFVEFEKIQGSSITLVPEVAPNITNVQSILAMGQRGIINCDQNVSTQKITTNAPFRVFKCENDPVTNTKYCFAQNYTITACLWPTRYVR